MELPNPEVPKILPKGDSIIEIFGYVISGSAKKYWNVSFVGTMVEHDGKQREYIIGHLEIDKLTGQIDEANIRYSRFRNIQKIAKFVNILVELIETEKRVYI